VEAAPISKIAALVALIMVSGFFSSSEAALFSLGLYRVRRLKATARRSYLAAQKLLEEPTKLISTILAGNEITNVGIAVIGSSLVYRHYYDQVGREILPLVAVAYVLPFVLIFGEIIPKTIGLKHPEKVVALNAVPLLWFSKIVAPLRDGIHWVSKKILTISGSALSPGDAMSEDVFRSMVDVGTEEGVVDAHEQRLIHNVFNLDDLRVDEIMTPVDKISYLRTDMTIGDVIQKIKSDRYSRFPVLDSEEKKIVGTLYIKDLLGLENLDPNARISGWIRPPLLVARETTALHLFAQFRSQKTHFAVVCGTFTHEMVGLVTLDDILKRVFGEIRDERDIEEGSTSKRSS